MDFTQIANEHGLWAAIALVLATFYYRTQEARMVEKNKQIDDCNARVKLLEDEARKALTAKDMELSEWKRLAWDARNQSRSRS